MDRGAWRAIIQGVEKNQAQLSNGAHTQIFRVSYNFIAFIKLLTKFCLEPVSLLYPKQTVRKPTRFSPGHHQIK